ncbi:MAG: diacylglycerol kinase family protein [Crocinitomicaceae bacterium]
MISSFKNAFRGLFLLLKTERNFQIHALALLVVIVAGCYFDISRGEWAIVLIMSAIVLGLEGLNSAIEKLCDEVTMERKESIRNIKDIAAGAVLVAAMVAVAVACIIFYPYLVR